MERIEEKCLENLSEIEVKESILAQYDTIFQALETYIYDKSKMKVSFTRTNVVEIVKELVEQGAISGFLQISIYTINQNMQRAMSMDPKSVVDNYKEIKDTADKSEKYLINTILNQ